MDFVYINQHVLDNLFYILVSILLAFILFDNTKKLKRYKRTLITISMGIPIILCMKFPIYIDEYCVHDLRQIPFFIGILYGGGPVGAALLVILLTARFTIYGFSILTLVVYIIIFIATTLVSKKFKKSTKKNKLTISVLLSFFLGILTTFIAVLMSDSFKVTEAYFFYFILLPPFIMFFAIYLVETLRDLIIFRSKLVKLEKMEVVSQLSASIAHEVRNPLTVSKGFMHLLKDPNLSEEARKIYIQHIDDGLDNAESIISEYLAFAKPKTEKVDAIAIDRELKDVIEMIKPLANMNSIQISENLTTATVIGNAKHFQRCILNLIKNGIEAMPNGGKLSVITFTDKNDITIKISDNGVGMSKEQISRFGEPYYSSKEKGTGLGSMVAVKTIQTMNGTIDINSERNKGTMITIAFPLHHKEHNRDLTQL